MEILNKKNRFYIFIVIAFLVFVFSLNYKDTHSLEYLKIADIQVLIEKVSTPEDLVRGLSGRYGLGEDEGMLFVFDHPDRYAFWMKDMNFPIDIIWIGEDMKVIYIEKNASPDSYPTTFGSNQDSLYVLEVKSGFSDKYNLKVGDSVSF